MFEWIDANLRKPSDGNYVLVKTVEPDGTCRVDADAWDEGYDGWVDSIDPVTHWMPIPTDQQIAAVAKLLAVKDKALGELAAAHKLLTEAANPTNVVGATVLEWIKSAHNAMLEAVDTK